MAKLMRYSDAEYIREATPEEQRASIYAAAQDGGAGVIILGDGTRAYVEVEAGDALPDRPGAADRDAYLDAAVSGSPPRLSAAERNRNLLSGLRPDGTAR